MKIFAFVLLSSGLYGQSYTLTGPASPIPTGPMTLSVGLTASTTQPDQGIRALQFTCSTCPAAATITAGPAATAAGKSIQCNMAVIPPKCIVYGTTSAGNISPGVVATIAYTPTASGTVTIDNGIGALPLGTGVPIASGSYTYTLGTSTPTNPCDLNGDGKVDNLDQDLMRARVLAAAGTTYPTVGEYQKTVIAAATNNGTCTL